MIGSLRTVMHSLRNLAISVNFDDYHQLKMVPDLLRCFPCLEILDVQVISCAQIWHTFAYYNRNRSLGLTAVDSFVCFRLSARVAIVRILPIGSNRVPLIASIII